jgi:hypothetical protein
MTDSDNSPTLSDARTDTSEMSNEELDRTAAEADPDDLGGSDLESGLTAGGTDTAMEQPGAPRSGGGIRGHGGGGTAGGTSSGTVGGSMEPGEDEPETVAG